MPTVKELFENMPKAFNKEAAAGMNAVFQYDITGDGGGKWHTEIKDGKLAVVEGQHKSPSLTVTVRAEDYVAMAEGILNGQQAFLTGKLKITGDMTLAMKLQSLFST